MKKTIFLSILTAICASAIQLSAESVTLTTPGTLADKLAGQTDITTLDISGPVNAADFDFINRKLHALTVLNLSDATIEPYTGQAVLAGRSEYPASQLPAYALSGTPIGTLTLPTSVSAIGEGALASSAITSFTIPPTVTSIGTGAFSGCSALKEITIPSTVTSMDSLAFAGCTALRQATLAIQQIPAGTFKGCSSLTTVTASAPLTVIGNSAFQGCVSLTSFAFGPSLTAIGDRAFLHSGLEQADLRSASRLTSIGSWSFAGCDNLTTVQTNDALTSIGKGAFFGDTKLTSVSLPSNLVEVCDYLFTGDSSLADGHLLSPVTTSIGRYAYTGLGSMTTISLPASLESIGDNAMEGWKALDSIHAQTLSKVPALGSEVWKDVDQPSVTLKVDNGMEAEFMAADQWKEFHIITPSAIDDIAAESAPVDIKAWFEGKNLIISAGTPITDVTLAGVSAMTLAHSNGGSERVSIDTSRWSDSVYILSVTLTDGRTANLKLAR